MRKILYAVTAAALALGVASSTSAGAAPGAIQPGVYSETSTGGCTLNFIYDGLGSLAGRTYVGTAAHCVADIGDPVALSGGDVFGKVAYTGNPDVTALDFAFVEVAASHVGQVRAAVKGYPSYPKGVTGAQETARGDGIQLSGYGVGYDLTTATQEKRTAVMGSDSDTTYDVIGPIHFGDSGGPLVHIGTGKALGIVSRLCVGACTEVGPTVAGLIATAAEDGFPVRLRTV